MTADVPLETFILCVRRSKLLEPAYLDRLAARFRSVSGRAFAEELVRSGELTPYQVEKLLKGKWQGLVLGPYAILTPIGRGGMGTVVYLARDRRQAPELGDSILVALKLLPQKRAAADPKAYARFRREMGMGGRVNHPNVVRTIAAGCIDDIHYLALEYVPGQTVRALVAANGPLSVGEAARIFADVAAGLQHVHDRGLVHRDVKPANVMVRPDGRAVLLDLGLAYMPGEHLPDDPSIAGGRGFIVGTLDYLAPEQSRNAAAVGPPADVYSLGCSLFFALTGQLPFAANTPKEKIDRHRSDPPQPLPNVPAEFARIVHSLMAKEPDQRPPSAAAVRELLLPWATEASASSRFDPIVAANVSKADSDLWEAVLPAESALTAASRRTLWMALAAVTLISLVIVTIVLRRL